MGRRSIRWQVLGITIGMGMALAMPSATASTESLDALATQYRTPEAIARFLHATFRFQRDEALFGEVEHWQTPEEFLARKRGDCEDYALLAHALLTRNGITAHVFSVIGEDGYAHTVCLFVDSRGRYNVINQDKLRYYRAASLEALASQLYPAWNFGGISEPMGRRGRLVQRITNPHPAPSLHAWANPLAPF